MLVQFLGLSIFPFACGRGVMAEGSPKESTSFKLRLLRINTVLDRVVWWCLGRFFN